MKTPEQIRDMEFQKSPMGGYKQSDVELFLEEVASQIEILMKQKAEADRKLAEFSKKAPEVALSTASIQNVLVNAQRVADQIVDDAKAAAERTASEANYKLTEADIKARDIIAEAENKAVLLGEAVEAEAAKIIAAAVSEAQTIIAEAKESVELEKKLYDRLKIEIADFRKKAAAQCNALVELINQLPSDIPFNMERSKAVLAVDFSDPAELLKTAVDERLAREQAEAEAAASAAEVTETAAPATEEAAEPQDIVSASTAETPAPTAEDPAVAEPESSVAEEPDATPVQEPADGVQMSIENEAPAEAEAEEDDEEVVPFAAAVKKEAPQKPKGRISFGEDDDDEDDDDDDDDEPRLFFRRKKNKA